MFIDEGLDMAKKSIGALIKEARTGAGLTQEQLARKIKGISAADISKAERGELTLTQAQLKEIAKATGVTQKSLLDAAGGSTAKKPAASSSAAKKPAASSSAAKKPAASSSAAKKPAGASDDKLTSAEKKLVELYRKADKDTKEAALALLKGEKTEFGNIVSSILGSSTIMDAVSGFLKR